MAELQKEIKQRYGGLPLDPNAIAAIDGLVVRMRIEHLSIIRRQYWHGLEMKADVGLYTDPNLEAGIRATLGKTVAKFVRQDDA